MYCGSVSYFVFSLLYVFFFFFKQKTAYEMRISDWSSDVCSSDLLSALADMLLAETVRRIWPLVNRQPGAVPRFAIIAYGKLGGKELGYASDLDLAIGRASCRERVCQYV